MKHKTIQISSSAIHQFFSCWCFGVASGNPRADPRTCRPGAVRCLLTPLGWDLPSSSCLCVPLCSSSLFFFWTRCLMVPGYLLCCLSDVEPHFWGCSGVQSARLTYREPPGGALPLLTCGRALGQCPDFPPPDLCAIFSVHFAFMWAVISRTLLSVFKWSIIV